VIPVFRGTYRIAGADNSRYHPRKGYQSKIMEGAKQMKFVIMHDYGVKQEAVIRLCGEKHNRYDYAIVELMERYNFKYYHDYTHERFLIWHGQWERLCDRVMSAVEEHNAGEPTPFDTNVPKAEYLTATYTVYGEYSHTGIE
jgi:hypothetical protein